MRVLVKSRQPTNAVRRKLCSSNGLIESGLSVYRHSDATALMTINGLSETKPH